MVSQYSMIKCCETYNWRMSTSLKVAAAAGAATVPDAEVEDAAEEEAADELA